MTTIAFYLLKALICSGILFLYYHLALRNKVFHQWNRFYLLSAVVLSLVLPLMQIKLLFQAEEQNNIVLLLHSVQSADDYLQAIVVSKKSISPEQWIALGYGVVCFSLLVVFVLSLLKIFSIIRSHTIRFFNNIKFINTNVAGTPFSFFNYVFWNDNIPLQSMTGQQIFQHELVHVKEKHTLDKLFMQVVLAFFWCNPFFWLMRKELRFLHEFIADKKAVANQDATAFAAMILQAAYPQQFHSITNQFFQTSIKRRLAMLTKIQNPKVNYVSRIIALPLLALVAFAFTVRTKDNGINFKTTDLLLQKANSNQQGVDTIPKTAKDIHSLEVDKNKNSVTVTYKDGKVEKFTTEEFAKRNREKSDTAKSNVFLQHWGSNGENDTSAKPLIIVDGKEYTSDLKNINPDDIQAVTVLKDKTAVEKYGEKAKNGVIIIITKKGAPNEQILSKQGGEEVINGNFTKLESGKNNMLNVEAEIMTIADRPQAAKADTTPQPAVKKVQIEASVNAKAWRSHLEKSLQPLIANAASKGMKPGQYTVNVRFIVELDGSISDVKGLNDPGYGLGQEVVNTVCRGPKWNPARQNGRKIRSYHTQPISFAIEEQ